MKIFIILISICFSIVGYGQQQKTKPISQWQPIYFIDSVKIDLPQLFFDPNKIADINVVSNNIIPQKKFNAKISINPKNQKLLIFYPLLTSQTLIKRAQKHQQFLCWTMNF